MTFRARASTAVMATATLHALAATPAGAETYVADCRFPTYARADFRLDEETVIFRTGRTGRRYRYYFSAPLSAYREAEAVFDYEIDGALIRRDLTYFLAPNQVVLRYTENDPRQGFVHTVASVLFERTDDEGEGVDPVLGRLPEGRRTVIRPAALSTQGNVENEPLIFQRAGYCAVRRGRVPEETED